MGNVPEPFGPIQQSFVWHSLKKIASFHLIDQRIVMRTLQLWEASLIHNGKGFQNFKDPTWVISNWNWPGQKFQA